MSKQVSCGSCGGKSLKPTDAKGFFQCTKCGETIDARGAGNFFAKMVGTAAGTALGIVTMGLIPDEAQAAVEDFFEDLFS